VIRTRVGYTGGTSANPTYYAIGDHSETVQIDFDPTQISYEELLSEFWDSHTATYQGYSAQYRNILHYHNEAQRQAAEDSLRKVAAELSRPVLTEIRPASAFYMAEDYHQKYYVRSDRFWSQEMETLYPDPARFRDSTLVARINGCLAGYCTREQLQGEIESYGLSPAGEKALEGLVRSR